MHADHAVGNIELRSELRDIFASRTSAEWVQLGERVNTPIVNVNTPQTIAEDPQFQDRFPWLPREVLGTEQLVTPIKLIDESLPVPSKAPTVGQHTDEVLRDVLGYDDATIASLRATGALG